jgi:mono/diheme cytochrome c family protein
MNYPLASFLRRNCMKSLRTKTLVTAAIATVLFVSPLASFAGDATALYKSKCAMCHGPDGKGETPTGKSLKLKDLASAEVQKASDADFTDVISKGKGKMPAAKGLTPDQVKDLVAFVRSLGKK